jgi:hypothetical protein
MTTAITSTHILRFLPICLKNIAAPVGVLCVYSGAFLYEDAQGHIQNKLEEWWVKLADV